MQKKILLILLISFSWTIGLQGIVIPANGYVLSKASSGIAEGSSPSLNPAINKRDNFLQFSMNNWLVDISGNHIAYHWSSKMLHELSIQSWNVDKIQLWGDNPGSNPLGSFAVNFVSASYCISHNFNTNNYFGVRFQSSYSHLFTDFISSYSLDFGTLFELTQFINLGFVIKNFGVEYTKNLKAELPMEMGIGTKIQIPFGISILYDMIHQDKQGIETRLGLTTGWKWLNFQMGSSLNKNRNAKSLGFSFNYNNWLITYGIFKHENSILGTPKFIDIRHYF